MPWIATIAYEDATGKLRSLYDRIKGPGDNVDNIMMMHSLRPHTMEAHMAVYKYVLHHSGNTVPKWFLEAIGVWVSVLNRCDYCIEHHFAGLKRLMDDDSSADELRKAMERDDIATTPLSDKLKVALRYAQVLTVAPSEVTESLVVELRDAGWTDGEILEINQVSAYFAYANRTVLGLGCSTDGDILGLSPGNSADPDDWNHG